MPMSHTKLHVVLIRISDNWEATVLMNCMFPQLITSAVVFSFGSKFRRGFYKNTLLVVSWISLYILSSVLMLAPSNWLSRAWHMASEQFNVVGTSSPVWATYNQGDASRESPAMPSSLRFQLWFIMSCGLILSAMWQALVVDGPIGQRIRKRFPSNRPHHKI